MVDHQPTSSSTPPAASLSEVNIISKMFLKVLKTYSLETLHLDDVFSLWDISKPDIETFIEQANLHHPTIKFTAEISDTETVILDTTVYKGTRFRDRSILDVKTHFKPTETFQDTHISRKLKAAVL